MACGGELLIREEDFLQIISYVIKNTASIPQLIEIALQDGIIQRTVRKFSNLATINFISLRLRIISHESL